MVTTLSTFIIGITVNSLQVQRPALILRKGNLSETNQAADLEIKRLFFSAPKAFSNKQWPPQEAGVGIAIQKLDKLDKQNVSIKIVYDDGVFNVSRTALQEKIKERDCYNRNGRFLCGYLTRNDVYTLARALKKGAKTS